MQCIYLASKNLKISSKKKSTVVRRTLKPKSDWFFPRLKCTKITSTDVITSLTAKNRKNNVFRSKQTTKKVPSNIFRGLEVRGKLRLMFWRPKDSMKGKNYVLSGYKKTNKVFLVYLNCKLQQQGYDCCIFKLKRRKTAERTYLEWTKL